MSDKKRNINKSFFIKIGLLLGIITLFFGCFVNNDWHSHRLEINTETGILTVDGVISSDFKYSIDKTGITLSINEKIDTITWHWNITNNEGLRFEPEIIFVDNTSIVFIPHDFEKYPENLFVATTYLQESYIHFIGNIKQL